MILTYDSILGIPTVQNSGQTYNENNSNEITISPIAIISFGVIILLFVIIFSSLGKQETSDGTNGSNSKLLTILVGGVVIAVILLNGLQYFFDINLSAQLNNLFAETPSINLEVEQQSGEEDIAPVPEIKIKKQVFHVPGNNYTYNNASAICKAYGAKLASYNNIEKAYKNGAEWCSYGWSDDQMALFPTQKDTWKYLQTVDGHENDCGRPGINGGYIDNKNVRFGVNCYGYKPKMTQEEQNYMENSSIYPRSMKDVKEQKQVDYWRSQIPNILVAPFNKDVWSLV